MPRPACSEACWTASYLPFEYCGRSRTSPFFTSHSLRLASQEEPTLRAHVSVNAIGVNAKMSDTVPGVPITHPEEMLGGFDLHIGKNINLKGSGRITPAGIVTVGLMTVAIFLAATALVRAARQ
jgi:hypothetical protein